MYKTRRRALILDRLSSGLITVVGLSVILAVAGMMLFLVTSSWPLFKKESFESSGTLTNLNLPANTAAGTLLFDDVAPIAFVSANLRDRSCLIQGRELQTEKQRAETTTSAGFSQNFEIVRDTRAERGQQQEYPLTLTNPSASTSQAQVSANDALECVAQNENRFLIRDGQNLRSASLQIHRSFLTKEDLRLLTPETRRELNKNRWAVSNNELIVKPSAQSPSAKITLRLETEWSVPGFFSQFSSTNINLIQFIRRPGKKDGVFVINDKTSPTASGSIVFFNSSQNDLTGETKTELRTITTTSAKSTSGEATTWKPIWIEGRYLLIPKSNRDLTVVDIEDAQLSSATLTFPSTLGSLKKIVGNFGGASVFAEFKSETNAAKITYCASLDAGRGSRLAFSATSLNAEIPSLWFDQCQASVSLLAHPHQRAVYRWLDTSKDLTPQEQIKSASTILEARELTTGRVAAKAPVPRDSFQTATLDAKGNFVGWTAPGTQSLSTLNFSAPHLEVSMRSLFSKIHYESYENASYSWQSTSGTDEFQAKFSLIPLIWGTIKATLYSLIFAVPLAIFAAVYSSEILDRQTRNIVKPTLEMMASVPSVVLGFLAAIIVAPWIETHIVSVLLIGICTPFMLYTAGVFLQVPSARHLTTRGLYASRRLLMWVIVGFCLMIWMLSRAGLWVEKTAFGGDLKSFLAGGPGTEGVLWGLLILPLVFIGLWSLPIRKARNIYRMSVFILGPVISVWLGSMLAGHTTLRADVLGQYAQRNTLVISIAMGFAIIPIIYSLAEDALTSVPNSLRAGSLACGASVWQTTARVVLPTAASGIFSAIMVGLGRGIGETMIAVMATGNTAVMTFNPFDGLRSMAANIAVELPEAAQGSTHYRILFLSALVLFLFTFTLNSFAELLRARYRARNKAL